MSREYIQLVLLPDGIHVDPDHSRVRCEAPGCTRDVLIGTSFSFKVMMATTGVLPIRSFECEEEQHFACSPEHAKLAAVHCMDHLLDLLALRTADALAAPTPSPTATM